MTNRKEQVKELMENFQALRRTTMFHSPRALNRPRITPSQWGALMCIKREGKSTVKDVAKTLGITSSAGTQLVDGLVKSNYVAREISATDRRKVVLTLSKKTEAWVNKKREERMQKFLKFFEVLNDG